MSTDDRLNAQVAVAMGWKYKYMNGFGCKMWTRFKAVPRVTPPPYATAEPDSDEAARLGWEMLKRLRSLFPRFVIDFVGDEVWVRLHEEGQTLPRLFDAPTLLAALARAVVACAATDAESAHVQEASE